MKVLLAIKEEFANKIFEGEKKYEFRKSIFKDNRVRSVVVYVTSPIKKVIGEFEIDNIIYDEPNNIWKLTNKFSGIDKEFFDEYFSGKETAYAIKIKRVLKYDREYLLEDFNINFAPQSYVYIDGINKKLPPTLCMSNDWQSAKNEQI